MRLRTAPHRADGVDVEMLLRLVRARRPRLVYLLPAVHTPVGVQLPPSAGRAVADAMVDTGGVLLTPGPVFSATEGQRDRLRLPFAAQEAVHTGVERLAALWRRRGW